MSILQAVMTAPLLGGGGGGGGGGDGAVGDYLWDTAPESYTRPSGGTDPVLTSLLMPDNSTTKNVHVFSGTNYISTQGHGIALFYFNIWFYPTSNHVGLMAEQGGPVENTVYYYNALEIGLSGNINASVWTGSSPATIVSSGSVTLNAWNHLYFYYNNLSTEMGISLNNATTQTTTVTRSGPDTSYFLFGSNCSTYITSNARFQGKLGDVTGSTYIAGSNYNDTKTVYGLT
jgi:hypothetical protein